VSDQRTDYYLGTYIILAIGSLVTIMGFLGCCGAWKESPWMLGAFFAFLLLIFFGEIAVGIVVYLIAAGMGIFFMEILGMLCSLCLCCAVKRIEDMKA